MLAALLLMFATLIAIWPTGNAQIEASLQQMRADIVSAMAREETARAELTEAASNVGSAGTDQEKQTAQGRLASAQGELAAATEKRKQAEQTREALEKTTPKSVGRWHWANRILGPDPDIRLLLIVMIGGGIGSLIYGATAFSVKVANRQFGASWLWWYALRVPTGMALALLLYLVIRGGLFAGSVVGDQAANAINPYGIVAMAALTGMFAEQASDKLKEIFEGLFRTADKRGFAAKAPVIDQVQTVYVEATGDSLKVPVKGRNFTSESEASINGKRRQVEPVDDKNLIVVLIPEDVKAPKQLKLKIVNKDDKGGSSEETTIYVAIEPHIAEPATAIPAGASGESLKVKLEATGVLEGATATVDGQKRKIDSISDSGFTLVLKPDDVGEPKTLKLKVVNLPNKGGTTVEQSLKVG